jgi:hypothetical protein
MMMSGSNPFLVFRCTDKVTQKINGYRNDDSEVSHPFLDWTIHLFRANRVQYLIYTNTASLLSFVSYGSGITDDTALIKDAISTIRDGLKSAGLIGRYEKYIGPSVGAVVFTKTNSRVVLGSMNDLIHSAKWLIENRDHSPFSVSMEINQMPMKAIKYDSPLESFKKLENYLMIQQFNTK